MKMLSIIYLLLAATVNCSVFAGDWEQWRGPFQNGSAEEKNLPAQLSLTENLLWSCPLPGPASATPIVSKGRVFISSIKQNTNDLLAICVDAGSGKILWEKTLSSATSPHPRNMQGSCSPAANGQAAVFLFADGTLAALNYEGSIQWQTNIVETHGALCVKFGYSSSPLIFDGKVYVPVLRRKEPLAPLVSDKPLDSYLLAYDIKTGKPIFNYVRANDAQDESQDSYITPMVYEQNGQKQILLWAADYMSGHDPATGQSLWQYFYMDKPTGAARTVPMPVVLDGLICYPRPRGQDMIAFQPQGSGKLGKECLKWHYPKNGPECSSPLLYKGNLYFINDRNEKLLTCLDAKSGQIKWQEKLPFDQVAWSSPAAADDKIYAMDESGTVIAVAADAAQMKILSQLELNEAPSYSSIAIADGRIFVRTAKTLYCFGNK